MCVRPARTMAVGDRIFDFDIVRLKVPRCINDFGFWQRDGLQPLGISRPIDQDQISPLKCGNGLDIRLPKGWIDIGWRRKHHPHLFSTNALGKVLKRVVHDINGWLGRTLGPRQQRETETEPGPYPYTHDRHNKPP